MNLSTIIIEGTLKLKEAGNTNAAAESKELASYIFDKSSVFIYANQDFKPPDTEVAAFFELIRQRSLGTPLQYLTFRQQFMSHDFTVSKDVLIPRQDTEVLVETAMKIIKELDVKSPRILEIGTGSGCISASLAYYLKTAQIVATDISEAALKLAKENARRIGVAAQIKFVKHNIFDDVESLTQEALFDVLISNPPYIPTEEISSLSAEVKDHEPKLALDGGLDGLKFYRRIAEIAPTSIAKGGAIILEVGYNQAAQVAELFGGAKVFKDLAGIDRVVMKGVGNE